MLQMVQNRRVLYIFLLLTLATMGGGVRSFAQLSITSVGSAFTENFDGMGSLATATLPSGFRIASNAVYSTATTATTLAAGTTGTGALTGTSAGGAYNFANGVTASASDRAFGILNSSSYSSPRTIMMQMTNNTGTTISSLSISFDYEKYRTGSRAFDWTFFHGSDGSTWTSNTNGDQSYAADANSTVINNPPTTINKAFVITGISIANGASYYLRWTFTGVGGSTNGQAIGIDNFIVTANLVVCNTPDVIEFVNQPSNVLQDATMSTVTVRAFCSATGFTAAGFTGNITLAGANGACGYTSQTVAAVGGIATFSTIKFTRSVQNGIKFNASSTGFTTITSDPFSVTTPAGLITTTTLIAENFESASTWAYSVGTPVYKGSGGTANGDVVTIKNFNGNNTLVKSYLADNSSSQISSTNTITFANQTINASLYDYASFSFQIASLSSIANTGVDGGDDLLMEISLDGGTNWSKLLTYFGNSNYVFPFSSSPVEALAYNANASYVKPSTSSAFLVTLPSGTTQFQFRVTATNNRTDENWAIDNLKLEGTTIAAGAPNALPTVANDALVVCPSSSNTITVVTSNTQGAVTYSWSPNTNISSTTISNPVVNPPGVANYVATITDADGCIASGTISITNPAGTTGTWTGLNNSDWFQCLNWGGGIMPDNTTDVTIPAGTTNKIEIDPTSSFASGFSYIARAKNITINDLLKTQANANLNIAGNLTLQSPGTINMDNGGNLDLSGNWANYDAAAFSEGVSTINFVGSGTQTITNTTQEVFYNLSVNKPSGVLSMNNSMSVANNLTLTKGIITTGNNLLTWNNTGTLTQPAVYNSSYICLCNASGNTTTTFTVPFTGAVGFKIKNVGANTWFPVGADLNTPNRVWLDNTGTTDDITVTIQKGDIGGTTGKRVNRIWYLHQADSVNKVISANMRLYFTKQTNTGFLNSQDEIEDGFNYGDTRLISKNYGDPNYTYVSQTTDIRNITAIAIPSETYAQYSIGVSANLNNVKNGVTALTRFSISNISEYVLPAIITNVKAWQLQQMVHIEFTAISQTNIAFYEIEKSANGILFTAINKIYPLVNGSIAQEYTGTDAQPFTGNNYYRIKITDKDNSVQYSQVLLVNTGAVKGIRIFPNPLIQSTINIQLSGIEKGVYHVKLYQVNGKPVWQQTIQHQSNANASYTIPFGSALPKGIYLLHISGNHLQWQQKLMH